MSKQRTPNEAPLETYRLVKTLQISALPGVTLDLNKAPTLTNGLETSNRRTAAMIGVTSQVDFYVIQQDGCRSGFVLRSILYPGGSKLETSTTGLVQATTGNGGIWVCPTVLLSRHWRHHLRRDRRASKRRLRYRRPRSSETSSFHALPDQWPVHHGRPGLQFLVLSWRTWICLARSVELSQCAEAQSHLAVLLCFCYHTDFVFHVPRFHDYENSWLLARLLVGRIGLAT